LEHKDLQKWFDKFKVGGSKKLIKERVVNQIFHRKITRFYREVFDKWRKNAEMLEVKRFINEEGPQAMEVYYLKDQIKCLGIMLKDKMIHDDESIAKVIKEDDQNYINKINKAKSRL